jgi:hypothetical protein
MDLALALLLLWGLLFVPIGLVLHWLVLGEGARVRALPLAPVTGVAIGFVTLATLGRIGIDAGEPAVAMGFVAVSLGCIVAIWRAEITWHSRELVGAGFLLLFAVLLIQLPVIGDAGDGPLGYGTAANPVEEVAAIEVAAQGPSAGLAVAREAEADADERPIGFEQFAALTVGIGQEDKPKANDTTPQSWTAYTLHAPITGMLAALITLPLFAFAKARGVRWFGLTVLAPLGVLAPAVFLALANGEGAAIASVPFTTAAVFSLLVTRRDRGWWALVVLNGAAIAVTAGPLALLPLTVIGLAWMFLRSDTYEHLSQHDTPVAPLRTLVVTAVAALAGLLATLPLLVGGGELLAWEPLHATMLDAIRSWPFAWLDSDLSTAGPEGPLETVIWLIGPALLAVAVIYAIVRNERRELGVLAGAIVAGAIAAAIGIADTRAGIRLFEFVMLSASPFLAALALRAVALARENAEEFKGTRQERLAGLGPTLLVIVFVLMSFAATAVTGTRMVHAPSDIAAVDPLTGATSIPTGEGETGDKAGPTLIAAGDPWLEFALDGERVERGYADADALVEDNEYSSHDIWTDNHFAQLVLSSSPLSSDPPLRWIEQSNLDSYQVRMFVDSRQGDVQVDPKVDTARFDQRAKAAVADRPGTETPSGSTRGGKDPAADVADAAAAAVPSEGDNARYHIPVEGVGTSTPPDRPAGLLLPSDDVVGCGTAADVVETTCEPADPVTDGTSCTDRDVAAARSPIDRTNRRAAAAAAKDADADSGARPQVLSIEQDPNLPRTPPLVGVQCFDVPISRDSSVLLVHLRDIGLILPPEHAEKVPAGAWDTEHERGRIGGRGVNGGTRLTSSELDARLLYGGERLQGAGWDLVLEGDFGAGVSVASEQSPLSTTGELIEGIEPLEIGRFRGSADGFSTILRNVTLSGPVSVINTAGTDVSLGRMFARPRDLPRSCDVPIALSEGEQREIRMDVDEANGGSIVRPGLTVSIDRISGSGAKRTARVVVGTYLTKNGVPRYTLVDWTEQFETGVDIDASDGTVYHEEGAVPLASDEQVAEGEAAGAFGDGDAAK